MSRDDILAAHPLDQWVRERGGDIRGGKANRCPKREHPDFGAVSINLDKQLWQCFGCNIGGSVIDWVMHEQGLGLSEAMGKLGGGDSRPLIAPPARTAPAVQSPNKGAMTAPVASYVYTDENGNPLYRVNRFSNPKTFRQEHWDGTAWKPGTEGVLRVLYRLPEVLDAEEVVVVEGEKDADNVCALSAGVTATTNVSGAGKWLDGYSECLAGKHVVVIPDNDEPGRKHCETVLNALLGKVKTLRKVEVPAPHKDISDWLAAQEGDKKEAFVKLVAERAKIIRPGYDVPLSGLVELAADYRDYAIHAESRGLSLSGWLPGLHWVRKLVPGDFCVVLASTGGGKTAFLQNLALQTDMPTVFFELELPKILLLERFVQITENKIGMEVEKDFREGRLTWAQEKTKHIQICDLAGLDIPRIRSIVERAELKIGEKPRLVIIDYLQLVTGHGKSRYERLTDVAEGMKTLAKDLNVILVAASQMHRPNEENGMSGRPTLHSAKDSGGIENSCGLMIGLWPKEKDSKDIINLEVIKNTKGKSGHKLELDFALSLRMTERLEDKLPPREFVQGEIKNGW